MSETDQNGCVGEPLPTIARAEKANGPFRVSIAWKAGKREGRTDVIDVAPQLFTFKVYRPLRDDRDLFAKVAVGADGSAIVWPGNDDLEISADALEEMAEDRMSSEGFSQFIRDMRWTFDAAACQLGISRRLVAYYAKEREVPRYIALACEALRNRATEGAGLPQSVRLEEPSLAAAPISTTRSNRMCNDPGPLGSIPVSQRGPS